MRHDIAKSKLGLHKYPPHQILQAGAAKFELFRVHGKIRRNRASLPARAVLARARDINSSFVAINDRSIAALR